MTAEEKDAIGEVLSEFGCSGPCAHGACSVEKECEECKLNIDTWCLACRIYGVIINLPAQNANK